MKQLFTIFAALMMAFTMQAQTYEPFEFTNLQVTPMEGFDMLEASNMEVGLAVVLGVYENGALHPGSSIDFSGTELPILTDSVPGTVVKEYSEDLATDVYTAKIIVDLAGSQLGLELIMYAGESQVIEIEITEANAEYDDLYGHLLVTATWEGYPVLLTIAGYESATGLKEYEGPQISELTIGNDDNWYDFAVANAVAVINEDGALTIEGDYTSYATGATYHVIATTGAGNNDGMIYEPFVMSNLVVTPMEGFIMLEASDDMMGLSVVLGVYEDGSLHEGSMVNFAGMDLPILSGNVTYQYSEEFATDVYVARLIVDLAGQQLGLELTMYGAAAVEIEITEATASVVESTGVLEFKAAWESYPVLATVAGYQEEEGAKEYDGVQISELTIGDDDNWYDFATANVVTVTKEGKIVTLEGEYNGVSGAKYLVVITGTMDDTAVDNVITTTTAVKVIKNGQLIINKNGVEYNAQGATVK